MSVNLEGVDVRPRVKERRLVDDDIRSFLHTDYARVVRAVTVVCGDRGRAEDAVQDAVVDVWMKRRPVEDLAAWVTTAALNRARSRWRSAAAERRAFERFARRVGHTSVAPVASSALDDRIAGALGALPRNQRAAVALHYLLDMSVADVALRLGVAEGTAKVHLHRGRHALQAALLAADDEKEIDRVRP